MPTDDPTADRRPLSLRALAVGTLLAAACAALVTWSDAHLVNTAMFTHFLPPLITLVLLAFALVINPLLGKRRFRPGEMAVIVIMLLGIGGVVTSGLLRLWPNAVAYPSKLAGESTLLHNLRVPAESPPSQRAEVNDHGSEHGEEWRWPFKQGAFIGFPENGEVDTADAEYRYVVDGALTGLDGVSSTPRVRHRSTVTWRELDEPGQPSHQALSLSGSQRLFAEQANYLDLDTNSKGQALLGQSPGSITGYDRGDRHIAQAGDSLPKLAQHFYGQADQAALIAYANGIHSRDVTAPLTPGTELIIPARLQVEAVRSPGVPWADWLLAFMHWSPLFIGMLLAMICMAAIVRRQWMEHERLNYPVAQVMVDLCAAPKEGNRFAALFKSRVFWAGVSIPAFCLIWRGLHIHGMMPVDFKLHWHLMGEGGIFSGSPWDRAYWPQHFYNVHIIFSIIALAFFMTKDVGFSMWSSVVFLNIAYIFLASAGLPMHQGYVRNAATGAFGMMFIMILFIGRRYYWALLKAAFFGKHSGHSREVVWYVWGLIGSVGLTMGYFWAQGAHFWGTILIVTLFLGHMLVVARILAETGIPLIQAPNGVTVTQTVFAATGFMIPVTALIPLTMLGMIFPMSTQNALPYAVSAGYVAERNGLGPQRSSKLLMWAMVIAFAIGGAALLAVLYLGGNAGHNYFASPRGWVIERGTLGFLAGQVGLTESLAGQERVAERRYETWLFYGIGALVVLLLSAGRLRFSNWPLHPVGLALCWSAPAGRIWFSVFLGWMAKVIVMRYGGHKTYQNLRPFAIGLIAGEAISMMIFITAKMAAAVGGHDIPSVTVH